MRVSIRQKPDCSDEQVIIECVEVTKILFEIILVKNYHYECLKFHIL